jgi:SAM-dependent methyltransferase
LNYAKVSLAYITLLQRTVDKTGLEYWKNKLSKGDFSYKNLLDTIYHSPEFLMKYRVPFSDVLHSGRQQWCAGLDHFEYILDIGGSSPNIEKGALIELGYQHRPKELIIYDLPEDEQYWGKPKYSQNKQYDFAWGSVKYFHGRAEQIHECKELSKMKFDCIFMGQTIEHIKKEDLSQLLHWIRTHLNNEGRFIFDTPNRIITAIQSTDNLIDPDHKYEYTPREMEELLNNSGFKVIKKTGILDMPYTYESGNFNPLEVYETNKVNENPDTSYVFAFECIPID